MRNESNETKKKKKSKTFVKQTKIIIENEDDELFFWCSCRPLSFNHLFIVLFCFLLY